MLVGIVVSFSTPSSSSAHVEVFDYLFAKWRTLLLWWWWWWRRWWRLVVAVVVVVVNRGWLAAKLIISLTAADSFHLVALPSHWVSSLTSRWQKPSVDWVCSACNILFSFFCCKSRTLLLTSQLFALFFLALVHNRFSERVFWFISLF